MDHKILVSHTIFLKELAHANSKPFEIQDPLIWVFLDRLQLAVMKLAFELQQR